MQRLALHFQVGFKAVSAFDFCSSTHVKVSHVIQADWKAAETSADVQVHRNLYFCSLPPAISFSKSHFAIC
jgi:hypothetical protein